MHLPSVQDMKKNTIIPAPPAQHHAYHNLLQFDDCPEACALDQYGISRGVRIASDQDGICNKALSPRNGVLMIVGMSSFLIFPTGGVEVPAKEASFGISCFQALETTQ